MTMMFNPHPKLSKPLVYQIEFHLNYKRNREISDWAESLQNALSGKLPKKESQNLEILEELLKEVETFPEADPFQDFDEHFYRNSTEDELINFSFGPSSSTFTYRGEMWDWESIQSSLLSILSSFYSVCSDFVYLQANLIYKNKIDWENGEEGSLIAEWLLPNDKQIENLGAFIGVKNLRSFGDNKHLTNIEVMYPATDSTKNLYLHIEINSVANLDDNDAGLSKILKFLEEAHDRIYVLFIDSLNPKFVEEIT